MYFDKGLLSHDTIVSGDGVIVQNVPYYLNAEVKYCDGPKNTNWICR